MPSDRHFRARERRSLPIRARTRLGAVERDVEIADLGLGGAFVVTADRPAIGADVELVFITPTSWDPLILGAQVRWVRDIDVDGPTGFGVSFAPLGEAQAAAVLDLVEASRYVDEDGGPSR